MNIQYLIPKNLIFPSNPTILTCLEALQIYLFPGLQLWQLDPYQLLQLHQETLKVLLSDELTRCLFCNQLVKMVDEHQKNILGIQADIFFSA